MLKLKPDPTFTTVVKIPTPVGETAIKVTFKHMTKDAYAAFVKREGQLSRSDEEAILDVTVGWEGVDADFNAENLHEFCQQYHSAANVIAETFIRELTQYKRGN